MTYGGLKQVLRNELGIFFYISISVMYSSMMQYSHENIEVCTQKANAMPCPNPLS